ncbi:MAG: DUF169 domain-containing protein [Methanomicrobiales archaeon]|jgi:uncharacterized protein (DUF169 family)|nr:DUF169 domain-containing protein [Methanomicrobiales archaeon]
MIDENKMDLNYQEIAEAFKNAGISGSPVAVKFAKTKEGIPEGVEEIAKSARHCNMVGMARTEGSILFARADKHMCMGGAWALGLKELTPTLKSGEFYFKLGKFASWAGCMRTIASVPHVHPPGGEEVSTYATVYAPLEKTPFDPHVVLIMAQPLVMLKIAQAVLYKTGGRIHTQMSGIQSVCADTCAYPYMSGNVNFSLGCDGSRKFSGVADDLMVMGIPAELIQDIADALPIIVGAAGSKK